MRTNKTFSFLFVFFIFLSIFYIFTPKVYANSPTIVTNNITENITWNLEGSPYLVVDHITVIRGVTLTIDAGVVVKFDDNSIAVLGTINVNGTSGLPVFFTSYYDDTVSGSIDDKESCYENIDEEGNDLGEICETYDLGDPSFEDWHGIFVSDITGASNFSYANFSYARTALFLDSNPSFTADDININEAKSGITISKSTANFSNLKENNVSSDGLVIYDHGIVTLDGFINAGSRDAVSVYNTSSLTLKNASISSAFGDSIAIFNDSSLISTNVMISESFHNSLAIFNNSKAVFNNSKITNGQYIFNAVAVFNDSSLSADKTIFDGGLSGGIEIFNSSKLILTHSVVKNFLTAGIEDYGSELNSEPNVISINNSSITNNDIGLDIYNAPTRTPTTLLVSNNIISDNTSFGARTFSEIIDASFEKNWWGDKTGPYNDPSNPDGLGDMVSSHIAFTPWCLNKFCSFHESVIIIPGIMGSEIVKNYDDFGEVWPNVTKLVLSFFDGHLDELILNPDGTESVDRPMLEPDIIRKTVTTDTFDGLIKELTANGYEEGKDLFVFPYDWRKDNAETALKLKEKIAEVLKIDGGTKVDIVAHSMGGLVAKAYIAENGVSKVDQLFFVGTPHLGAPKAFKALMYGDDMGINTFFGFIQLLSPNRIRVISQNMPAVYELLPSRKYVDTLGFKYVKDLFTGFLYGAELANLNYADTQALMVKDGRNKDMFLMANSLHESIDSLDLSKIDVYNFIGAGTKTLGKIIIKNKRERMGFFSLFSPDYMLEYVSGDKTVPKASAEGQIYGKKYYVDSVSHSELPSFQSVRDKILEILKKDTEKDLAHLSKNQKAYNISGKVVSSHDSVVLHIYDDAGHHTGPVDEKGVPSKTNTGHIEQGISGVSYDQIGANSFAFLPAEGHYKVVNYTAEADSTGYYNFYIENIDTDDIKTKETYWDQIPVKTPETVSEIDVVDDVAIPDPSIPEALPVILVDNDGDGVFEQSITPSSVLDTVQASDLIPPVAVGSVVENTVSIISTDENSGVLKTEYSTDGATWLKYEIPILVKPHTDGTEIVFQYFSTDKAGNVGEVKTLNILPSVPEKVIAQDVVPVVHSSGGGHVFLNNQPNIPVLVTVVQNKEEVTEKKPKVPTTGGIKKKTVKVAVTPNIPKNKIEPIDLTASAGSTGTHTNTVLLISVIGGSAVLLLAKRFIKM